VRPCSGDCGAARDGDTAMAVRIRDDHDQVRPANRGHDAAAATAGGPAVVMLELHADRLAGARPLLGGAAESADHRDPETLTLRRHLLCHGQPLSVMLDVILIKRKTRS